MKHWLQLIRVPNLLTVPGDPLAGFLLAYGNAHGKATQLDERAAVAVFASLCLYSAGLIMNDLFDYTEDLRERPSRPLPSGKISIPSAWIAGVILGGVGIISITAAVGQPGLLVAVILMGCILLYNGVTKRLPVIGALNMGACRGLSMIVGAVAATGGNMNIPFVVYFALILTGYVAAVTNLARHETRASAPPIARALPLLVILGAFLFFNLDYGAMLLHPATTVLGIALIFIAAEVGRLFRKNAPLLPPVIGALIRALLPIQAAFCLVFPTSTAAWVVAIGLLLVIPAAQWLGRRFYAS